MGELMRFCAGGNRGQVIDACGAIQMCGIGIEDKKLRKSSFRGIIFSAKLKIVFQLVDVFR